MFLLFQIVYERMLKPVLHFFISSLLSALLLQFVLITTFLFKFSDAYNTAHLKCCSTPFFNYINRDLK